MPIERSFEALTPVPPDEVYEVFSDLQSHIPLWSTYESIRMVGDNEAEVTLRISGNVYNLKAKLTTEERRTSKVVVVECRGQIYLHLRLTIEPRGIGSLVTGRIYLKAGFLRERILSPAITSFIDDLKNKIMFQLPSIAEVIRRRKVAKQAVAEAATPKPSEAPAQPKPPEKPPVKKPVPKPERKPEAAQKPEAKAETGLPIQENPDLLADTVSVGMILLRSELVAVDSFEGGWKDFESLLMKYVRQFKGEDLYVRLKAGSADIKVLIKEGKVVGLRIESGGEAVNGAEALERIKESGKLKGKAYVFKVPKT
ncbi:MAG: SRPBCC family protein [Desulfurococcales archaeon]|nr:SRPBCC family protein [Desulfurococcales archaeon]